MQILVEERRQDDREVLNRSLDGEQNPKAIDQLAGSLRNMGYPTSVVTLARDFGPDKVLGAAPQAFLGLAFVG